MLRRDSLINLSSKFNPITNFLSPSVLDPLDGETAVVADFEMPPVLPARYLLDLGLSDGSGKRLDEIFAAGCVDVSENNFLGTSHPYFREMGHVLVRSTWTQQRVREPQPDHVA